MICVAEVLYVEVLHAGIVFVDSKRMRDTEFFL